MASHGHDSHAPAADSHAAPASSPTAAVKGALQNDVVAEVTEGLAGEQLENFLEEFGKKNAGADTILAELFRKVRPYMKNKTVNNIVANVAAGFIMSSKRINPMTRNVLRVAIKHAITGLGEAAADTLKEEEEQTLLKHALTEGFKQRDEEWATDTFAYFPGVAFAHWAPDGMTKCSDALTQKQLAERTMVRTVEKSGKGGHARESVIDSIQPVLGSADELARVCRDGLCPNCTPEEYIHYVRVSFGAAGVFKRNLPIPKTSVEKDHASAHDDHHDKPTKTFADVLHEILATAKEVIDSVFNLFKTKERKRLEEIAEIDVQLAQLDAEISEDEQLHAPVHAPTPTPAHP